MTAAEMDLVIGADVTGAVNGMKKVQTQLKTTEQTATKAGVKSTQAFTDFNRVIQDAPFGFIAIQNNISPLIDSFRALQEQAKSAGVSLGSVLASALSGPAGVGLAISAVTAAITFLQVGFRAWFRTSQESADGANEFADALHNITIEAENVKTNMASLTDSLQAMQSLWAAQNKVRFFSNDAEANLLEAKDNIGFVIAEYDKLGHAVEDARKNSIKALDVYSSVIAVHGQGSKQATDAEKEYNNVLKIQYDLEKQREDKGNELAKARAQRDLAQLQFNKALADEAKRRAEEERKAEEARIKASKIARVPFDIHAGRVTPLQDTSLQTITNEISAFLAKHPLKPIVTINPILTLGEQGKAAIDATFGLINQQIVNGLAALGESLGNAIVGAKNPFGPVLAFIADGLKTIGKAYIEIGVQMLLAKRALSLLAKSPVLTIAAGIAIVALGQILSAKANNIKAFATGGVVTKPTLALVGEQGPERITPLGYEGRANNMMQGEVIFQISGQNLRGILRRADQTAFNTF